MADMHFLSLSPFGENGPYLLRSSLPKVGFRCNRQEYVAFTGRAQKWLRGPLSTGAKIHFVGLISPNKFTI